MFCQGFVKEWLMEKFMLYINQTDAFHSLSWRTSQENDAERRALGGRQGWQLSLSQYITQYIPVRSGISVRT